MKNANIMLIVFTAIMFLNSSLSAATYYVSDSDGNDSYDGLYASYQGGSNGPWQTIGKVNSYASGIGFTDGDTIKFKRDDTFDDASLTTPGADNITIEDYGEGSKPHFDGDVNRPINIYDDTISNLTIRNIDISGQEWKEAKDTNLVVSLVNGVTIDGIFGIGLDDTDDYQDTEQVGKTGIIAMDCTGAVVIKNCELYNWGPYNLPALGAPGLLGIVVSRQYYGSYKIYNNLIHDVNSDCIQVVDCTAPGEIYDNILYNGGENCIDLKSASNVVIRNNDLSREATFGGGNGGAGFLIVFHSFDTYSDNPCNDNIITNNYLHGGWSGGILIAEGDTETVTEDNIISYNTIINCTSAMSTNGTVSRTEMHHNLLEECTYNVGLGNGSTDTKVYNNIFIAPKSAISLGAERGCISENNSRTGNEIYNNTFSLYSSECLSAITLWSCMGTTVKNNIVYMDNDDSSAYPFWRGDFGDDPVVDHNIWYNANNSNRIYWNGVTYSSSQQTDWQTAGHSGDLFGSPLFVDVSGEDYRLQSGSPAIDAGVDVGLTEDYDGTPIPYNDIEDIGAYEYPSFHYGLTGWWEMDESTGTAVADASGNDYHGYLINGDSSGWETGLFNNAYYLDSSNSDYIEITSSGTGKFDSQEYTITAWFKSDTDPDSAMQTIWSYDSLSFSGLYYAQHLRLGGSGGLSDEMYFGWNNGTTGRGISAPNALSGTQFDWHHVVVTFKYGEQKLYLDGELIQSTTYDDVITYYDQEVWIGRSNHAAGYFDGLIDDVRFYNRVINANEVTALYSQCFYQGLAGWWKMDESTGTAVADASGNDYHGSLINGDSSGWETGLFNNAFHFDSSNSEYVQITSNGTGKFDSQEYTITAWFKSDTDPDSATQAIWSYDALSHSGTYYAQHLRLGGSGGISDEIAFSWNNGTIGRGLSAPNALSGTQFDWHHVVVTFKYGEQKLYLDGELIQSTTYDDVITYYDQEVWIGRANFGAYFDGIIDDVRFYNRVLNATEVTTLYSQY